MRILITGSTGQLGWELARVFPDSFSIIAADRNTIDLAKPSSIARAVRDARPDVILNAAGYTAVDRAEDEQDLAFQVNADSVGELSRHARASGTAVVHFSTDYVFDGAKQSPYTVDDRPNPQSAYGRSKLDGEIAVQQSGASYLVLRTCWVYGLRGHNFLLAMLRQAETKSEVRVVNDQVGSPTWARAIARATAEIVTGSLTGHEGGRNFGGREGIYHLSCTGSTTWFDFARAIFEETGLTSPPRVTPITTADFSAKARRPAQSALDCSKTFSTFGVSMPAWRDSLREALSDRDALAALISRIPAANKTCGVSLPP